MTYKTMDFLKQHQLDELVVPFKKLKDLYIKNIREYALVDDNLVEGHVVFMLIKMNSLNLRGKDNPYKIKKADIISHFGISNEKIMSMNFHVAEFITDNAYMQIKDYLIPYGEKAYAKKVKNGASKIKREINSMLEKGEIYALFEDRHVMYCPYNLDSFFFQKLHLAFDIKDNILTSDNLMFSNELLHASYANKEEYWDRYHLLFTSLLYNPFNIDSILEVSRMQLSNGIRNGIIDYLIDYCNEFYDENDYYLGEIEMKPYLRVVHQKALWCLEDGQIEEAKEHLYKCLEISFFDSLGARFILDDIDDNFNLEDYMKVVEDDEQMIS
jgi:hypothetical protein